MNWKRFGKALLFPHIAVLIVLLPIATVFLVYSLIFFPSDSVVAVISYVLASYTLMIWCFRVPRFIRFCKKIKTNNTLAKRWSSDARLRVRVSLYGSLIWNTAYAALQLGLGCYHSSFWFYTMAAYYSCLALMRFFLARYTGRNVPGKRLQKELMRYRACGWILLVMNVAVSVMIFFMVYWDKTFVHHEITTIAMATYTFTALTVAIINVVKYRRYNSPVYSASKAVSLVSACVSMLTLESTMLTTFDDGSMGLLGKRVFMGVSGAAVSVVIVVLAMYMIISSYKKQKALKNGGDNDG